MRDGVLQSNSYEVHEEKRIEEKRIEKNRRILFLENKK